MKKKKNKKQNEIIEILTQCFIQDRLDKIVKESTKYAELEALEKKLYDNLKNNLNEEQKDSFEDFCETILDTELELEKIAYQQGLKDMYNLLKTLSP